MINGVDEHVRKLRLSAHQRYKDTFKACKTEEQKFQVMRELAKHDRFFLLIYILKRQDADTDWVFERCREVENDPDNRLDIWSREHYKTSCITYAGTIQEHIKNPDTTIAIFSFNRPIAKSFFRQIKWEYENNELLRSLFSEIFWDNVNRAPKWSEDDGLVLRRSRNTKEASLEAWGLIDGQPTSKHFDLIVYNDIVTGDTVSTPDMIKKTTTAWENSLNLSTQGGRIWYEGTFWNYADTYNTIIERGAATPRIYPGTDDGTSLGKPVLFSDEYMAFKKQSMSSYVFACQILCNPKMADKAGFELEWVRYWNPQQGFFTNLNKIIIVDPATTKRAKESDYTSMWVIGMGPDQNYYVVDMVRDRLGLYETAQVLFKLHAKHRPSMTFYEEYGMQRDIEYLQEKQQAWNYRFHIGPLKGIKKKEDRISRLQPLFRESRIYLPETKVYTTTDGEDIDLIKAFIYEELILWPYSKHDDMLDSLSRILDAEGAYFPVGSFDDDGGSPDDVRYDVWTA